ncbi:MAG TPA: hypothetical protein VLG38_07760 [Gammaproteobacteria bacterium]|nr:hypothetical protein [Gammaproteobacteria bacterium]
MLEESLFEESFGLRLGYIICFVTAVGFICSLTYNYGYFWHLAIGIRILSIGDILTSYTLWIPGLASLVFVYGFDIFVQRIEARAQNKMFKKHKKLLRKIFGLPHIALFSATSIVIIAHLIFGYTFRPLLIWFAYCYVWLSISALLYASKLFVGRTNRYILGIFLFTPVILSLMFALGLDKSHTDGKLNTANAKISFISVNYEYPIILLRHLERGLLAKEVNSGNYAVFIWDDISSIEILAAQ